MTKVAIIIVSYNTREELVACLESLHNPRPEASHEVVVVDNGSIDGSPDAVRSRWPSVRLIETGENLGYARANNRAIRTTDSELLLLLNSDTVVPAGAVDMLIRKLDVQPDIAVVGPRLVDADGNPELSFGSMIGPFNEVWQKLRGTLLHSRIAWLSERIAQAMSVRHEPDWVSGACLLVRRSAADAAGLLDERFFLYAEDVDFCASIRQQGAGVLFTPDVDVVHHRGRSRRRSPARAREDYRRSQLAFYAKHHPIWAPTLRLYLRIRGQLPSEPA